MSPDTKKQIVAAVIGLTTGVASTYAMVWRDVAVIKSELRHINRDIEMVQRFISSEDPKLWRAAKRQIDHEHKADEDREKGEDE